MTAIPMQAENRSSPAARTAGAPAVFDILDQQFAAFLQRLAGQPSEPLALAAMLVSRATRAGHVCIDLRAPLRLESAPELVATLPPPYPAWRETLMQSPVVGVPGDYKPLVLDAGGRLYLQRYWQYETIIAQGIQARQDRRPSPSHGALPAANSPALTNLLDGYFGPAPAGNADAGADINWQRRAVEIALTRCFAVISGGPGTGKTYT